MRTVEEELQWLLELGKPTAAMELAVADCAGCVLAEAIDPQLCVGTLITERHLPALFASGRTRLRVHPRPRVAVVSVGEGDQASGASISAAARAAGVDAFPSDDCVSDPHLVDEAITDQLVRSDLILVLAEIPVIMGEPTGTIAEVVEGLSEVEFHEVAVAPGPVIAAGTIGPDCIPFLTLPREADEALIAFEVFARPLIRALAGRTDLFRPVVRAWLAADLRAEPGIRNFVPAVLDLRTEAGQPVISVVPNAPGQAAFANALVISTEESGDLGTGREVAAIRLDR